MLRCYSGELAFVSVDTSVYFILVNEAKYFMVFRVLTIPNFIRPTRSSFKKDVKFQPTASLIFAPQQVAFVPVYFVIIHVFLFGACVAYRRPSMDWFLFVSTLNGLVEIH